MRPTMNMMHLLVMASAVSMIVFQQGMDASELVYSVPGWYNFYIVCQACMFDYIFTNGGMYGRISE